MDIVNEFRVNLPIDQAWAMLTDLERIAPCMPGADLHEIDGDTFHGVVKVKVGPITTAFKGQATFLERDDDAHTAVLKGDGRDSAGKGNASALITAKLTRLSEDATSCSVHTDLSMSGKVAQFGRGAMTEISQRLMAQFASNLNAMLDAGPNAPSTVPASQEDAATRDPTAPSARAVSAVSSKPLNVVGIAWAPTLKRIVPLIAAVTVLALSILRLRTRRHS